MVRFENFNRRHGLFRPEYLASPRLSDMVNIEFPTGSVLHYLPDSEVDWAPEPTWWMARKTAGEVWVDHLVDFATPFGKTQPITGNPQQYIRKYHQRYQALRKVIDLSIPMGQAQSTIVINHALARHYFKYTGQFIEYSRNRNMRDNIFAHVAKMVQQVDRHHFIPVKMPSSFPALNQINKAANEEILSVDSVKRFMQLDRLMFLEFWRWLGDPGEGKDSKGAPIDRGVLSQISQIPADKIQQVNFVFVVRGNWYMVNLADLAAMKKTQANPKGKYDPVQLQKRFLNGVMQLVEAGVVAEKKPDDLGDLDAPQQPNQSESEKSPQEIQTHNEVVLNQVQVSKEISSRVEKNQSQTLATIGVASSQGTTVLPQSVDQVVAAKDQAAQEKERSEASLAASAAGKGSTELTDAEIDANLEALERVDQIQQSDDFATPSNPNSDPLEEGILKRGRNLAKDGLISGAELRRIEALSTAYKKIKNPWGPGLLHEYMQVSPEELQVKPQVFKVKGPIFDESMLSSSSREMNRTYLKNTLNKDLAQSVIAFQRSGYAVTDFNVDRVSNVSGKQQVLSFRMQPIGGAPSTLRVMVPIMDDEGMYRAGGTRYRMRQQRGDLPIRKVAPDRVSLTSYYGKVNVSLSERETHNYGRWLTDQISAASIDKNSALGEVHFTNVFDRSFKSPKAYSRIAHSVHTMELDDMFLTFKQQDRFAFVKPDVGLKLEEQTGGVICGRTKAGKPVLMMPNNEFVVDGKSRGTIESLLNLDSSSAPHQMVVMRVRGQWIPLGVVLANYHGLSNLIQMLKATTRRVLAGDRLNLQPWEFAVRFSDESLVLDSREQLPMLLLSGFRMYHKEIRSISIYSFDQRSAYGMLIDAKSRNGQYSVELDHLDEQWVDPMTARVLKEMGEPTEWRALLMRAAQLLLTDYSPDATDGAYMLIKGYERVAGAVYREMVVATRQQRLRSRLTKAAVDMKPTAVWNSFNDDSAIGTVNDCNPIADIRAAEAITYIGSGGKVKRSMVAQTRKFHPNDQNVISEQTVDSGDVGINVYSTANPKIVTTGGLTKPGPFNPKEISSMVSTAAMLSPGADIDDPKRVNFIGIQHGSGIGAVGYRTMPYGTGYEQVIAHRSGKKFAYVAKGAGVVTSIKNNVLKVTYEDKSVEAVEVGRVFTSGEGHTYPNDLICTVKQGDTVAEGDVLVYNNWFFEPSPFAARQVMYKHGVPARVALYESVNTLEDGSRITPRISAALRAYETTVRDIVVDFSTTVHQLVEAGEEVHPDDTLCTMEDPSSAAADLFSEETVNSLQLVVDKAPRAKLHGVVDHIEVIYNGDLEDMSPTLRKIVEAADRKLRNKNRDLGDDVESGRTDESQRINNQPLQIDQVVFRIHISHGRDAFAGDKGVFGNQLKSVFGQVATGTFETESGLQLDADFSDKGIEDRIVRSARKMGMMNALCFHIADLGVKAYRGK